MRGGEGLQLCRESLLLRKISQVSVLKNLFARIRLMACGPAGTLVHNSRPFCREFAHHTNTIVIASEREQSYYPRASQMRTRLPAQYRSEFVIWSALPLMRNSQFLIRV